LKLVFDNLPEHLHERFKTVDELREEIKIQIGLRDRHVSLSGKEYFTTRSMAFHAMGQDEFSDVYQKTVDFVCAHIIPGIESADIETQIIDFL